MSIVIGIKEKTLGVSKLLQECMSCERKRTDKHVTNRSLLLLENEIIFPTPFNQYVQMWRSSRCSRQSSKSACFATFGTPSLCRCCIVVVPLVCWCFAFQATYCTCHESKLRWMFWPRCSVADWKVAPQASCCVGCWDGVIFSCVHVCLFMHEKMPLDPQFFQLVTYEGIPFFPLLVILARISWPPVSAGRSCERKIEENVERAPWKRGKLEVGIGG